LRVGVTTFCCETRPTPSVLFRSIEEAEEEKLVARDLDRDE
jgi:hypothetical protein